MSKTIKVSKKCYSPEAIKRALYILLPENEVKISEDTYNYIISADELSEKAFLDKLLETQIQIDTEHEFYEIRNMLVAQALEPYQNVNDLLQRLNK
mgnify:CR=1 FL=1